MTTNARIDVEKLQDAANGMRISSIEQTCAANSGHPTISCGAAQIMATLFLAEMRYDVKDPCNASADRFILSKGHGQGLSSAAWIAYTGKYIDRASYRVYCLMGDGESAEGSVWKAAAFASSNKLDNMVAIVDVNRLGQSQETQLQHDIDTYMQRFASIGWNAIEVDGHDITALVDAYANAKQMKDKPTVIIAKTLKGKGIDWVADLDNQHGKPVPMVKVNAIRVLLKNAQRTNWAIPSPIADAPPVDLGIGRIAAYDNALLKLAEANKRLTMADGNEHRRRYNQMDLIQQLREENAQLRRNQEHSQALINRLMQMINYQTRELHYLRYGGQLP